MAKLLKNTMNTKQTIIFMIIGIVATYQWYYYNIGSSMLIDGILISSFTVTAITISFSIVTWIMISWAHIGNKHERKILNSSGLFASVLSGLLMITPFVGWVGPMAGIILGIFAGLSCYGAFSIKNKNSLKDTKIINVLIRGVTWYCVTVLPLSFWLLNSFVSHM